MVTTALYGVAVIVCAALAWASGSHVVQKFALVLLAAWASSNVAVAALGFKGVPLCAPTIEALCAAVIAVVGYANRSRLALVVFGLYGAMLGTHLIAYVTETTDRRLYFVFINFLFILQLVSVGGCGAWLAIRFWGIAGRERLGALDSHRSWLA